MGLQKILLKSVLAGGSVKAQRRRTTGTGRMRYLKSLPRRYFIRIVLKMRQTEYSEFIRFKNGFRENTKPKSTGKKVEK
jgi:hypothetical protein